MGNPTLEVLKGFTLHSFICGSNNKIVIIKYYKLKKYLLYS